MARGTDWIFGGTVLASVALESYALAALVASSFAPMRALVHGSPVAAAVVPGLNLTALNAVAGTLIFPLLPVVTAAGRERDGADTGMASARASVVRIAHGILPRREPGRHVVVRRARPDRRWSGS